MGEVEEEEAGVQVRVGVAEEEGEEEGVEWVVVEVEAQEGGQAFLFFREAFLRVSFNPKQKGCMDFVCQNVK